jgi:methylthioribose-1-phosphate isomerase
MTLEAIVYKDDKLKVLDQLLLPFESVYIDILNQTDGYNVIKNMNVIGNWRFSLALIE